MKKPIILEFWAQSINCTLQTNISVLCILRVWRDLRLSQRLDRLKHWRLPLCFTYLRPRWYYIMATATRSLIGICWNLGGGCWRRRPMLFSLAVLFTGSRFFAIIAEYQNEFYQIKQLVTILGHTYIIYLYTYSKSSIYAIFFRDRVKLIRVKRGLLVYHHGIPVINEKGLSLKKTSFRKCISLLNYQCNALTYVICSQKMEQSST